MRHWTPIALLLATAALTGCGSDPPPPPQAPPPPPPEAPPPMPVAAKQVDDNPRRSNIAIADDIRKACGISDAEAYFAFDSSNIRPQDRAILTKLANCFSKGPLKGKNMRLVGHTDPRGTDEYNMVLGGQRSDSVKGAISSAGLDSARIATTSRGELDATGTEETSWSKDRRVDIVLSN